MSSSLNKSLSSKSLSVQTIIIAGTVWGFLALLFFLLFGVTPKGQEHPLWYSIGTTVFELAAFLAAGILCFRNWRSSQIVSGRNVWLGIGLGMFSYFIGGLLFSYWEIGLGLEPAVSPGDFFYLATYLFLGWGMISAVLARRLNLEIWQWGVVAGIAAVGILLAAVVSAPTDSQAQALFSQPAIAQTTPVAPKPARSPAKPPAKPPALKTAPKNSVSQPAKSPAASPTAPSPTEVKPTDSANKPAPPEWAAALEAQLAPLETGINLFYVVSDIVLLIIATILLLAFWGGRSSLSWRMIAAAAFSLYIADMWFKYANRSLDEYQSGSLPEVFWVFSGILFGLGAALEYDLSTRSRRAGGRRRGA